MKRMWSKNELKSIADTQAKTVEKDITTLVDSQGHKRFIDGDITITAKEGITQKYGKWSLSDTHLLIVVAIDIALGTELTNGQSLCSIDIPNWIKSKIVALWGAYNVDTGSFIARGDDWSNQTINMVLYKDASNNFGINYGNTITIDKLRHSRIAFDLLIDND